MLALHEQVLASMGPGLAIGFYPSQWYANLALGRVDRAIKERILPDCRYVRYMDDMILLHVNKRKLHRARIEISKILASMELTLKANWQVYRIKGRGISFLSYRFFAGYTVLRKQLMFRITRMMRSAARRLTPHAAMAVMSYLGILRRCDSYRFRMTRVYPVIDINKCRRVIKYAAALCRIGGLSAAV